MIIPKDFLDGTCTTQSTGLGRTQDYAQSVYAFDKIHSTMQSASQHSVTQVCCNDVLFKLSSVGFYVVVDESHLVQGIE
jgi:hypothetical protein